MMIKSQDGLQLVNLRLVTSLSIYHDENKSTPTYNINACYPYLQDGDCAYTVLGRYVTKRQAKEILKDVEKTYQYAMECNSIGHGLSKPEFVYLMPLNKYITEE